MRTERQIESQCHTPQVVDLTTKHLRELAVSVFHQDATSQGRDVALRLALRMISGGSLRHETRCRRSHSRARFDVNELI